MANPVFPVTAPIYFYALFSHMQRPKIYFSESVEISLDAGQEAVPGPLPGKTRPTVYVSDRVPPRKTSGRIGKGSWDLVDVWDVLVLTHIGFFKPWCLA